MTISTHVLDTARGRPAAGVPVTLEVRDAQGDWSEVGSGTTDDDGRLPDLLAEPLVAGVYRLTFHTDAYFADRQSFYPQVSVVFRVADPEEHHHVPLLLSPYAFSTYRGS
ncbi:MAG: hydroxyisourate hydrolase [Actinomycetota bacterium]|nr:hydroxyisourate hydrolase [Actinomycetota bacterium]